MIDKKNRAIDKLLMNFWSALYVFQSRIFFLNKS